MKAVLAGAVIAAAAGLLMGAAAKPDLTGDDRPAGPQILAGWSGVRSTGPFDDGQTFTTPDGQVPDYVLGADWKKSLAAPPARIPVEAPPVAVADNDDPPPEPVALTHATYEPPTPSAPSYPSVDGGADDDRSAG